MGFVLFVLFVLFCFVFVLFVCLFVCLFICLLIYFILYFQNNLSLQSKKKTMFNRTKAGHFIANNGCE